jgi:hypothetical protein
MILTSPPRRRGPLEVYATTPHKDARDPRLRGGDDRYAGMPLIALTSMKSLSPNNPPSRPLPDAL